MPESQRSIELREKIGETAVAKARAYAQWSAYHERCSYVADHVGEDPGLAAEMADLPAKREASLSEFKTLQASYHALTQELRRLHDRESEMERRRARAEQAELDRRWRESHPPIR